MLVRDPHIFRASVLLSAMWSKCRRSKPYDFLPSPSPVSSCDCCLSYTTSWFHQEGGGPYQSIYQLKKSFFFEDITRIRFSKFVQLLDFPTKFRFGHFFELTSEGVCNNRKYWRVLVDTFFTLPFWSLFVNHFQIFWFFFSVWRGHGSILASQKLYHFFSCDSSTLCQHSLRCYVLILDWETLPSGNSYYVL